MSLEFTPSTQVEGASSVCRLCGGTDGNTWEHVPPRAQWNDGDWLLGAEFRAGGSSSARHLKVRGGHRLRSLCGRCNHRMGEFVRADYVPFVQAIADSGSLHPLRGRGRRLHHVPAGIDRRNVARQMISMLLSVNPPGFGDPWSDARRFCLGALATFRPPFRILLYRIPEPPEDDPVAGTITAYHARTQPLAKNDFTFSGGEVSWFPVGIVFVFDDLGPGFARYELYDATHWAWQDGADAVRSALLEMPILRRLTGTLGEWNRGGRDKPASSGVW